MIGRGSIGAVAGLLVLLGAASAPAQERECWRHSKGYFENTRGNQWIEKIDGNTYNLMEVERTENFIELHDKGRNIIDRLYANRCEYKPANRNVPFRKSLDGKWVS